MSGLPDQETKKDSYTQSEVDHLVAREVMKHRMGDLEQSIKRHSDATDGMFARVNESLVEIKAAIAASSKKVDLCRDDLRNEVERDFATKLELQVLEGKVDKMWAKITAAVGVVVVVIQYIFRVFGA